MKSSRILALIGAVLGIIPIALGVVAIIVPKWSYTNNISLFNINSTFYDYPQCGASPRLGVIQGLEIGGIAAIAVGIIASVLLNFFIKNTWIKLIPQILLIIGPAAIFTGISLLLECTKQIGLGLSIILIMIAAAFGYISAIYFAFIAGLSRHHYVPTNIMTGQSVRF